MPIILTRQENHDIHKRRRPVPHAPATGASAVENLVRHNLYGINGSGGRGGQRNDRRNATGC